MTYAVGQWGFVRWLGGPPRLTSEHVALFTKPGQPGVSGQLIGTYGEPFDVELHSAFADQSTAVFAENQYRLLVGSSPVPVMYNGVNYFTTHGHKYLVLGVMVTDFRRLPRQIGLGFDYIGGWQIRSRWQMQPIAL